MIFVCNMLMLSAHIVFNIPFDLMYDICYPLHVKTTHFCFCSGYCHSNNIRLTKIFDLLRLSLKIYSIRDSCSKF